MSSETLEKIKQLLIKTSENGVPGSFLLYSSKEHPLRINIGNWKNHKKSMFVETHIDIDIQSRSKEIEIIKYKKKNIFRYYFVLDVDSNEEVYTTLIADLIDYSGTALSESDSLRLLKKRYESWEKLLQTKKLYLNDPKKMKGLAGELITLINLINLSNNAELIIKNWNGPEKASKDFQFQKFWCEVKAIKPNSDSVSVSSIEQLSSDQNGYLIVHNIESSFDEDNPNYFTLDSLIEEIHVLAKGNMSVISVFNEKVLLYGYIRSVDKKAPGFILDNTVNYEVDCTFPRINKENISHFITEVKYKINLAGLSKWKIPNLPDNCF